MKQLGSTAQASLLPVLVLLLALLMGGSVWWLNDSHHKESEHWARQDVALRAVQLADAMAGQVGSLWVAMDLGLLQVREAWVRDPTQVPHIAQAVLAVLPEGVVTHLSIVDAEGYTGYSTQDGIPNTYVGNLDHFGGQQTVVDRMFIGHPVQGVQLRGWSFTASRPVMRDGRFAGSVNLAVRADAMGELLGRLSLKQEDLVALVQADGTLQASTLDNPAALGQALAADSPFLSADAPHQGQFQLPGMLDDAGRIFAWRRLPNVDQIVLVGLHQASSAALHAAENHSRITAWMVGTAGLAGMLLAALVIRVQRQRRQLQEDQLLRKQAQAELSWSHAQLEQRVAQRTAELVASKQHLQQHVDELNTRRSRVTRSQDTLSRLIRSPILATDLEQAFGLVTEQAAQAIDVARVSIWRLSDDGGEIVCCDLWDVVANQHSSGLTLSGEHVPAYFKALHRGVPILASDALNDPNTCEFVADYFTPLGITSLLDAPILVGGKLWGVICFEHIGAPRSWTMEHVAFVTGGAALVSLSIEMSLRRSTEDEMRSARDEAEHANAAKSDFLSRMSHELRTPLNAVLGFTQLLEMPGGRPLSKQQAGYVRHIREGGELLLQMVNELLDLARIDSGRLEMRLEAVALRQVIDDCVSQIEVLAQARRIGVTLLPGKQSMVRADPLRLQQVLLNLLSNAVKYNVEGGSIEIECVPESAQRVRVSVRDSGSGLSAEQQTRLFKPFERLHAVNSGIEGTGIGLALAKRLIEGMQGTIGVDSVHGRGSTFWFELQQCAELEPALVAKGCPSREHEKRIVLYVEDNPANVKLVKKIIGLRSELILIHATNAETGLEMARSKSPDLILLNINLPGMSGHEALQNLQASPATRNIPVIAVAAFATKHDIDRDQAVGFTAYLTMPLDVDHFQETLDLCLVQAQEQLQ